MDTGAPTTSTT